LIDESILYFVISAQSQKLLVTKVTR